MHFNNYVFLSCLSKHSNIQIIIQISLLFKYPDYYSNIQIIIKILTLYLSSHWAECKGCTAQRLGVLLVQVDWSIDLRSPFFFFCFTTANMMTKTMMKMRTMMMEMMRMMMLMLLATEDERGEGWMIRMIVLICVEYRGRFESSSWPAEQTRSSPSSSIRPVYLKYRKNIGTLSLSNPQFTEWHLRFTTVPLKAWIKKEYNTYVFNYFFLKSDLRISTTETWETIIEIKYF